MGFRGPRHCSAGVRGQFRAELAWFWSYFEILLLKGRLISEPRLSCWACVGDPTSSEMSRSLGDHRLRMNPERSTRRIPFGVVGHLNGSQPGFRVFDRFDDVYYHCKVSWFPVIHPHYIAISPDVILCTITDATRGRCSRLRGADCVAHRPTSPAARCSVLCRLLINPSNLWM